MIGVEFEYTTDSEGILKDLFENIPTELYDWYIYEDEIFKNEDNLNISEFMTGKGFYEMITDVPYLCYFININAYKKGMIHSKLFTYDDFIKSNCEFVVLIADRRFVEIYAKNESVLLQFIENAKNMRGRDIIVKTKEKDARTKLSVN